MVISLLQAKIYLEEVLAMKKNKVIYPEKLIRIYRIITLVKEHKMKQKQWV